MLMRVQISGGVVMGLLAMLTVSMLFTRAKQLQMSGIRMWCGNLGECPLS